MIDQCISRQDHDGISCISMPCSTPTRPQIQG